MKTLNKATIKALKFYKKHVSPELFSGCIFTPTCSEYAMEAFKKHGFLKALGLSLYRILRCNGFSRGGLDRVPDNKKVVMWII